MSNEQWLTLNDAAKMCAVSTDTLRRMISRGDLKAVRIARAIRIKPSDLEKAARPVTTISDDLGEVA